jgi:hypothetical protein
VAPGLPGAQQIPGLPIARPPAPGAPGAAGIPSFQLPTRVPRLPTPGAQASVGAPGFLPGGTGSPIVQHNNTVTPTPQTGLSLEEQTIMIEATRQAGGPGAALLPPTALTPNSAPSTPAAPGNNQSPGFQVPGRPYLPPPPGAY